MYRLWMEKRNPAVQAGYPLHARFLEYACDARVQRLSAQLDRVQTQNRTIRRHIA
jgi:hypothetical protein